MKLIVDHADLDQIKEMFEYFPVSGVTTNPTIITRTGKDPYEVLKSIREFIGADAELHAQVISSDAEGMMAEAKEMRETVGGNFYVKIPTTKEGLKAIKNLKKEGFKVTATAVYTSIQAYLAAEAGADYVAPYLNRIDNLGYESRQHAISMISLKTTDIRQRFWQQASRIHSRYWNWQNMVWVQQQSLRMSSETL